MLLIKQTGKIFFLLVLASFILISCSKVSKDEQANELLAGTWKATSIKDKDNFEYMGGTVSKNSMYFRQDSGNLGYMDWDISTSLVNVTFEGNYQVRDDGTRLLFGEDYEFILDVEKKELNITLLENTGNITFIAERQ